MASYFTIYNTLFVTVRIFSVVLNSLTSWSFLQLSPLIYCQYCFEANMLYEIYSIIIGCSLLVLRSVRKLIILTFDAYYGLESCWSTMQGGTTVAKKLLFFFVFWVYKTSSRYNDSFDVVNTNSSARSDWIQHPIVAPWIRSFIDWVMIDLNIISLNGRLSGRQHFMTDGDTLNLVSSFDSSIWIYVTSTNITSWDKIRLPFFKRMMHPLLLLATPWNFPSLVFFLTDIYWRERGHCSQTYAAKKGSCQISIGMQSGCTVFVMVVDFWCTQNNFDISKVDINIAQSIMVRFTLNVIYATKYSLDFLITSDLRVNG